MCRKPTNRAAYVAPKTKTWTKEEHEEIEDTLKKRKR